jgi:hypothetical protein
MTCWSTWSGSPWIEATDDTVEVVFEGGSGNQMWKNWMVWLRPRSWSRRSESISLIRAASPKWGRGGKPTASVVGAVKDDVWDRNRDAALGEEKALTLAYGELKAMRRKRGDSGKAAS